MFNTSRGRALQDAACVLAQGKRFGCRGARAGSRGMRDVGIGQFRSTEEPPAPRSSGGIVPRCHRRRIPIRLQADEGKNKAAGDGFRLILRRKKRGLDQGSLVSLQGGGDAHAGGSRAPRGTATPRSILGARRQPKASAAGREESSSRAGVQQLPRSTVRGPSPLPRVVASRSTPRMPRGVGPSWQGGGFCTLAPPCRNSLSLCLLTFNINSVQVSRGQIVYGHFPFI